MNPDESAEQAVIKRSILQRPTGRLFLLVWLCSLAVFHWVWRDWRAQLPQEDDQTALIVLGGMMALAPWVAGPGLMPFLRRRDHGGVNLPYAEYWFTGERREESLNRLLPRMEVMGALLSVFLTAILLLFLGERVDPAVGAMSALAFLAIVVVFLGATVLWVRGVMRAFPAPDVSTRGVVQVFRSRRPAPPRRPRP